MHTVLAQNFVYNCKQGVNSDFLKHRSYGKFVRVVFATFVFVECLNLTKLTNVNPTEAIMSDQSLHE